MMPGPELGMSTAHFKFPKREYTVSRNQEVIDYYKQINLDKKM